MLLIGTAGLALLTATVLVTSPQAYYVSPRGNDGTGDGSANRPFATLARALSAMEKSPIRTTYVEGGVYRLSAPLHFTAADSGEAFVAAPSQHPRLNGAAAGLTNLIVLDRSRSVTLQGITFEHTGPGNSSGAVLLINADHNRILANLFTGNDRGVRLRGSSNNLISGNEIDRSVSAGISANENSNANTIDSNIVDGTGFAGTGTNTAGIWIEGGGNDNAITHNLVENTGGVAISVTNWTAALSNTNVGNLIAFNSVVNADSSPLCTDSGGIYIDGVAGVDTRTIIDNNSVIMASSPVKGLDVGIYLDDFTSGVRVTNNILRNGNFAFQMHGGRNNIVTNNIFDIGTRTAPTIGAGLLQSKPDGPFPSMVGDVVSRNIIYSTAMAPATAWVLYGGSAAISDNLYVNINGQPINTSIDRSPHWGNPLRKHAAAGDYTPSSASAARLIGFRRIDRSAIGLAPTTAHWFRTAM